MPGLFYRGPGRLHAVTQRDRPFFDSVLSQWRLSYLRYICTVWRLIWRLNCACRLYSMTFSQRMYICVRLSEGLSSTEVWRTSETRMEGGLKKKISSWNTVHQLKRSYRSFLRTRIIHLGSSYNRHSARAAYPIPHWEHWRYISPGGESVTSPLPESRDKIGCDVRM